MEQIGRKTETDKILHHGYHRYYPFFLERWRDKKIKMLEIGYLLGQSHQMWVEYFPYGEVYFMEKDIPHDYSEPHFPKSSFYRGSQYSLDDMERMLQEKKLTGQLDFIIDDGSHHPKHQIFSFQYLFMHGLKPGGVYIIEDIEMNYWYHGDTYKELVNYGVTSKHSLIAYLKTLVDAGVNREFVKQPYKSAFGSAIDKEVSSVFFGHNCVIITKMTEAEKRNYGQREYRYVKKLSPLEGVSPAGQKNSLEMLETRRKFRKLRK